MSGSIRQTTHVNRSFEEVVRWLEADAGAAICHATDVATRAVDRSAERHRDELSFIAASNEVTAHTSAIRRPTDTFAMLDLTWTTDRPFERLLPNIDAQLLVHGVIPSGRRASTAISVIGRFDPHPSLSAKLHLSRRAQRTIDVAIGGFLSYLASVMLDEIDPPLDRRHQLHAA